jgi:hypothetical protein
MERLEEGMVWSQQQFACPLSSVEQNWFVEEDASSHGEVLS